jgi:hypothetical protein
MFATTTPTGLCPGGRYAKFALPMARNDEHTVFHLLLEAQHTLGDDAEAARSLEPVRAPRHEDALAN